jgi:hypothetical protein
MPYGLPNSSSSGYLVLILQYASMFTVFENEACAYLLITSIKSQNLPVTQIVFETIFKIGHVKDFWQIISL